MACCYSNLFNRLSGRMGRVIYYQVGDHLYARAAPGEVKDCRSELQLYYRERMRKTATFYGVCTPAHMVGPDLADVGSGGASFGI